MASPRPLPASISDRASDLLIVGGGIIGLAVGREAARAGLSVRLLERGEPGCEASSAAAGMLSAQIHSEAASPLLEMALASRDLYPDFIAEVREESGIDIRLSDHGTLVVARRPSTLESLEKQERFQRAAGLPVERLGGNEIRRVEPSLAKDVLEGLYFQRDGSVDNAVLVRALATAAMRAGVALHPDLPASRLLVEGDRIQGVETGARRFTAGSVLIAAGAWSGEVGGAGVPPLPTHPVRGQMVALAASAPRRVVFDEDCYLVPRGHGRLLVGSTMERVGFDRRVTAEGITGLAAAASALAPELSRAPILSSWAGLRPATDDGLPAIGPGSLPGLYYACGHLRHGILLAPITARLIVRLLRGEPPGHDLTPFDPRRFASRPA